MGKDGVRLLNAIYAAEAPAWLAEIPAVETLRRVWVQNFYWEQGELCWRDASNVPAAGQCIDSPYDPEAHYAQKRTTSWVGYKVHLTETCDDESPHLITHVQTTPAPLADDAAVPLIHEALAQRDLLPGVHLVDTGYVDAAELVSSQQDYEVELLSLPAPRLSLAGAGRDRVRGFPVCRGLAERVRHLSGGTDQQQLDTRPGSARQPGHQNQIRDAGLPTLPLSRTVHA